MARRLVEAGVPFVSVFGWGIRNSTICVSRAAVGTPTATILLSKRPSPPEFDRVSRRCSPTCTIVVCSAKPSFTSTARWGERRRSAIRARAAPGVRGAITGRTARGCSSPAAASAADRSTEVPTRSRLSVRQESGTRGCRHTIYHAMGIDNLEAIDRENRPSISCPTAARFWVCLSSGF